MSNPRPLSEWPAHGRFLIPQVNDTWNCFQKFCRGKSVSAAEWKQAKAILYFQYVEHLANCGEAHTGNRYKDPMYKKMLIFLP